MQTSTALQTADAAAPPGPVLVAVDVRSVADGGRSVALVEESLQRAFPDRECVARAAGWRERGPGILAEGEGRMPLPAGVPVSLVRGGIPGPESALGDVFREGERRRAAAVALVAGEPHGGSATWLHDLLSPVLQEGFDYVCPTYGRHALDGALNTGVVYPLTRTLYGRRLRQPLGGEAAVSGAFARRLLADPDWERDPASAGADAWLVAKALAGGARSCQAWLGPRPLPAVDHEDASHAVERVLGLVFGEMERHAERWQRVYGSEPMPTFGTVAPPVGEAPRPPVERLVSAFALGQRELASLWAPVLPPATLLALRRAAALPADGFRIDDALWARVVFDFAVAHLGRVIERRQLLRSMTPLYLGWVASFANETRVLDAARVESRVEALCQAFEAEKRYLMARWRWPDAFET
jgi:hypothetical protein